MAEKPKSPAPRVAGGPEHYCGKRHKIARKNKKSLPLDISAAGTILGDGPPFTSRFGPSML
jgi:hypothetical protein